VVTTPTHISRPPIPNPGAASTRTHTRHAAPTHHQLSDSSLPPRTHEHADTCKHTHHARPQPRAAVPTTQPLNHIPRPAAPQPPSPAHRACSQSPDARRLQLPSQAGRRMRLVWTGFTPARCTTLGSRHARAALCPPNTLRVPPYSTAATRLLAGPGASRGTRAPAGPATNNRLAADTQLC
jgi:hypothetical protein